MDGNFFGLLLTNISDGTLYGAIQSLEKRGWIRIYSEDKESRRKKEYLITADGRAAFEEERKRLAELLQHAALMEGESHV